MPTRVQDLKTSKRIKDVQIRLELGDTSDIRALARQLETFGEEPLCNIVLVDGHSEHVRDWTAPEVQHLFEVMGNLPNIVHLAFESLGAGRTYDDDEPDHGAAPLSVFPIPLLTHLLRATAGRLETLVLESAVLTGSHRSEMEEFIEAIGNLKALRQCCLTSNFDLNLQRDEDDEEEEDSAEDESFPLDGVVEAIAKLPLLVEVDLVTYAWYESGFPFQFKSSEPLKSLFEGTTIQEMTLGEFHLANEGLKDVARALETTTLRRLELHFSPSPTRTTIASLTMLAHALKVNTALETLKLEFEESCPAKLDSFLIKCAEALAKNTKSCLQKLKVTSPVTYGAEVEDAFCRTLQTNCVLQKLEFLTVLEGEEEEENYTCLDGRKRTEIDLFLRLNRRGRASLLQPNNHHGVSRAKWVQTLYEFQHDLDALHYYLAMNPWLCQDDATMAANKKDPEPMETEAEIAYTPDTTAAMLQGLQQLIATGFQTTQGEIQQLHRKVDAMTLQHAREKREWEAKVKRLEAEVAALKSNGNNN